MPSDRDLLFPPEALQWRLLYLSVVPQMLLKQS